LGEGGGALTSPPAKDDFGDVYLLVLLRII